MQTKSLARKSPGVGLLSRWTKKVAATGLVAALGLGSTGCLAKLILNGQIASTRRASVALNTVPDFDIAQTAAFAGLSTLEGLRYLAPENDNALFSLTRSWTSVAAGFIEDKMEEVEDAEGSTSPEYDFQKRRAIAAYERAIWYGSQLLEHSHEGLAAATKKADSLREYLKEFDDPEVDAENLFWVGYAWLGKTNVQKEKGAVVGQLFVGAAMLERSAELDENYNFGSAHTALGAYHARSPMAELDEAKVELEKAMKIAGDKLLLPKLQYAIRYDCVKGDKEHYVKLLNEIFAAGDGDLYQRLPNTIAKRRAKRYLGDKRMKSTCGF